MAAHHSKVIWTEGMFLRPQHFQQLGQASAGLADLAEGLDHSGLAQVLGLLAQHLGVADDLVERRWLSGLWFQGLAVYQGSIGEAALLWLL